MTDAAAECIRKEPRFEGIHKFDRRVPLIAPVIHGDETEFIHRALQSGFSGENICELEKETAEYIGVKYAAALSSGMAALHMAVRLAAERAYGSASGISVPDGIGTGGALSGKRVFCSELAAPAVADAVLYEGGVPVFIDVSLEDWCMDPQVLEMAFEKYPDVKIVVMAHLYGYPGQIQKIQEICRRYKALLIEDASESLGAQCWDGSGMPDSGSGAWRQTGSFGDYGVLSFGKNKIITGGSGGMLLTNDHYSYKKAQSWAVHADAPAPWNQHEELGYSCEMNDMAAGMILGQLKHLEEHIARKKAIYQCYQQGMDEELMLPNPVGEGTKPNYWISCMTVESSIVFQETRSEREYTYRSHHGTAAPMEIVEALEAFGAVGGPVYKPLHMQPVFWNYDQITLDGGKRTYENFYNDIFYNRCNESAWIFKNGICLPSDIGMTEDEQERVIEITAACFNSGF